jgi:hypothetical protein
MVASVKSSLKRFQPNIPSTCTMKHVMSQAHGHIFEVLLTTSESFSVDPMEQCLRDLVLDTNEWAYDFSLACLTTGPASIVSLLAGFFTTFVIRRMHVCMH